jgi:hypothetical protein
VGVGIYYLLPLDRSLVVRADADIDKVEGRGMVRGQTRITDDKGNMSDHRVEVQVGQVVGLVSEGLHTRIRKLVTATESRIEIEIGGRKATGIVIRI